MADTGEANTAANTATTNTATSAGNGAGPAGLPADHFVDRGVARLDDAALARLRPLAAELIARYPKPRSALLPMLHLVQSEQGYVSRDGIAFCAEQLALTKAEVAAVATFYTMYKRRPAGDWLVSVCTNTMCGVLGGDAAYQRLSELLGVGHDETTADGSITLEHAECLAACDYAPVMTVNYEFFDQIDAESAVDVVETLRRGKRPKPTRGAGLCTFKEMSRQLAGFVDDRDGAVADGPAGEPTLAGNRLAERHGISVAGFDPDTPIGSDEPKAPPGPMPAKPGEKPDVSTTKRPKGPAAKRAGEAPGATAGGPATKTKAEAEARTRTPKEDPRAAQAEAEGAPDTAGEPGKRAAESGADTAAEAAGARGGRGKGKPAGKRDRAGQSQDKAEREENR